MKVLQINKFLYPKGGAETYLLSLVNLLEQNGQEVVCFSQKNPNNIDCLGSKYFIDELDLSKFSFKTLIKLPRMFWSFKAQRLIKKLIKEYQPDVVHIHNIYHQISPSILSVIKRAGLPIVMTVHDFKLIAPSYTLRADGRSPFHKNSLIAELILRFEFFLHKGNKIYDRYIDLFIVPSEFVKEKLLANGFAPSKIKVIPHFLPDYFEVSQDSPTIKSKDKFVLSYGRLDENKGFDDLLKSWSELKTTGIKLKIAGTGPDEEQLCKLAITLKIDNQVEFLGQKTRGEIADLIKQSLFVINCSKVHETFGLVVLEAMALGKTVIASKVGAIPELIEDKKNGLLFEVADIGALKNAIAKLLSDEALRDRLAKAADRKAQEYNGNKHYQEIMSAYQESIDFQQAPLRRLGRIFLSLMFVIVFVPLLSYPFYRIDIQDGRAVILPAHDYPRLTNLYWRNPIDSETAKTLAKWDVLVLDMTAQTYSADAIKQIRQLNPKIIILAYTSAVEMPIGRLASVEPRGYGMWHDLASGDKSVWHLKNSAGQEIVFWPGNVTMNLGAPDESGRTYADYLVDFYDKKVLSTGLWDGVFFDTVWNNISWMDKTIDMNSDGRTESEATVNSLWQNAYRGFFEKLRGRLGSRYLILINGDGNFQNVTNGRMLEAFPDFWEGTWSQQMQKLATISETGYQPRLNIINSDTNNTGNRYDYQSMRYGFTSALMFDAYFSFDWGTNLREQLWWYDEYDASLGEPTGPAKNLTGKTDKNYTAGLWQRDFASGIILINSTDKPQQATFDAEYEKLHGVEDKETNNGAIINQIIVPANDGIVLLRPLNQLVDTIFINGSFAKIFTSDAKTKRTGFFVYDSKFSGNDRVIRIDINGDGQRETISAGASAIIINDIYGNRLATAYPYGRNFNSGINIATFKRPDGKYGIATTPDKNGSNMVKFFDYNLQEQANFFYAYSSQWKNLGASIAMCDVNGDGRDEVVTGAGLSGGPQVRIFTQTGDVIASWFAYDKNFRGGVNVACGDVNSDGKIEIVTGPGFGGGPQIRIFSTKGTLLRGWFAYDKYKRQGVKVSVQDIDGDGLDEIIALSGNVFVNK